jgi:hypothetical protein
MTEDNNNTFEWPVKGDEQKPSPELEKIFQFILKKFEPADSLVTADMRKTTLEIFNQVKLHLPDETIQQVNIFRAMEKAGFNYDTRSPDKLEFVWLLKKRKP